MFVQAFLVEFNDVRNRPVCFVGNQNTQKGGAAGGKFALVLVIRVQHLHQADEIRLAGIIRQHGGRQCFRLSGG